MLSKHQIREMALKLFIEKGFERTTMRDIAEALGVQQGTLYHHIKSKAELFYDILDTVLSEVDQDLRGFLNSCDMEPERRFRQVLKIHFKNMYRYPLEYQRLLNERLHMFSKGQEAATRKKLKAYENLLFDALQAGIRSGAFRNDLNPRIVLQAVLATGNSLYKWFSPDGNLSIEDVANTYIEFFLSAMKRNR